MHQATNYARDRGGRIEFLDAGSAPPHLLSPRWSFWRIPEGIESRAFLGRLIGETADERCYRLGHRPRDCARCQRSKQA